MAAAKLKHKLSAAAILCFKSHKKRPRQLASTNYMLRDWQSAGLRAESCFRVFVLTIYRSELTVIGQLSENDWSETQACVRRAIAV
jgi:hypothetical protein